MGTKHFDWAANNAGAEKYLLDNYDLMSIRDMAKYLCCSRLTVMRKAKKLGLESKHVTQSAMHPEFNEPEIEVLTRLAGKITNEDISFIMGRTEESIRMYCKRNGISLRTEHSYCIEEDDVISMMFNSYSYREIGLAIKRGEDSVRGRAKEIGLRDKPTVRGR